MKIDANKLGAGQRRPNTAEGTAKSRNTEKPAEWFPKH